MVPSGVVIVKTDRPEIRFIPNVPPIRYNISRLDAPAPGFEGHGARRAV